MTTKYRDGYKGQLAEDLILRVPALLRSSKKVETQWIILMSRALTIKTGYAWDYASGPTIDRPRKKIITPTLAHDALCQLERAGLLEHIPNARAHADRYFYDLLRERKFWLPRARLWYRGVRIGSKMEGTNKPILEAP